MKLLLYCTKAKWQLFRDIITGKWLIDKIKNRNAVNGKIISECDFEVSEIEFKYAFYLNGPLYITKRKEPFRYFSYRDLLKASCLQDNEILKYLGNKNGYAIHIKNLHIFDEPKQLSEYEKLSDFGWSQVNNVCIGCSHTKNKENKCLSHCYHNYSASPLFKAPQNMMYVFDNEEKKVLISIRPEWLCKILNGEKTIEVRKKVLKGMIDNGNNRKNSN